MSAGSIIGHSGRTLQPTAAPGEPQARLAPYGVNCHELHWSDSSWDLRKGVEVIELDELPAEYLRAAGPSGTRDPR